jgi:hypothetical protein
VSERPASNVRNPPSPGRACTAAYTDTDTDTDTDGDAVAVALASLPITVVGTTAENGNRSS